LAFHNLFVLLLKDEGTSGDLAGDGTGCSVRVDNHYHSDPRKFGKRRIHFFSLIDLAKGMYFGCGTSKQSEWDAFSKGVAMLKCIGFAVKSVMLDKYFSIRTVIKLFGRNVSLFLIPKKNCPCWGLGRYLD